MMLSRRLKIELRAQLDVTDFPYVEVTPYPIGASDAGLQKRVKVIAASGWGWEHICTMPSLAVLEIQKLAEKIAVDATRALQPTLHAKLGGEG